MVKTAVYSRIEVWSVSYINDLSIRTPDDKDVVIVQCEHGHGNDYIVEVIPADRIDDWQMGGVLVNSCVGG